MSVLFRHWLPVGNRHVIVRWAALPIWSLRTEKRLATLSRAMSLAEASRGRAGSCGGFCSVDGSSGRGRGIVKRGGVDSPRTTKYGDTRSKLSQAPLIIPSTRTASNSAPPLQHDPFSQPSSADTMKGCLKQPSPVPSPGPECPNARKCVAFEADGSEQVFFADEWDRTPMEPARKLSYQ